MKYDNEAVLLVAIFQKANPLEPQPSVAEYLRHFRFDIDRVGRVLRFLGLAEESGKSDLGCAPTGRLMSIIAEKWARPPKEAPKIMVSEDDRDFVASIYHLATGGVDHPYDETIDFCCSVLAILDLLEKGEDEDGDLAFKPTPRIKDLVLEHFLKAAVKEVKEAREE
jgi:hypothetical protein